MFGMLYLIVLHYNRVLLSYSRIVGLTEKDCQVTNTQAFSINNQLHLTVLHSGKLLLHSKIVGQIEKACQVTNTLAYYINNQLHLTVLHSGKLLLHSKIVGQTEKSLPGDKHSSLLVASDSDTLWQAPASFPNVRLDRKRLPNDKNFSLSYLQHVAPESAPLGHAPALLANNRLNWKSLSLIKTLAYFFRASMTQRLQINIESKHALPDYCMHQIILHGSNTS